MKVGDLVQHVPGSTLPMIDHKMTGIIISLDKLVRGGFNYPRAKVLWNTGAASQFNEVLLGDLDVINETR